MNPLAIIAYTATTALGAGVEALRDGLYAGRCGLVANDYTRAALGIELPTFIGRVRAVDEATLPQHLADRDCRNNRLAWLGLAQDAFVEQACDTVARLGAHRVALFVGSSTSTIEASEAAYRLHAKSGEIPSTLARRDLHHLHATTAFVGEVLGIGGPAVTVSTACSSSAKVFSQALRMIEAGVVDAAVVGGVDSLAASTLFGFNALGLVSAAPCRPFDARRDGISIGEAAGFAVVERYDASRHVGLPLLVGYGESSDAHHMSTPHPQGVGARIAIDAALAMARIAPSAVDHVNLHGTATPKNDAVEAAVVAERFGDALRASSTKGATGHALGAAGIVEAVACLVAMRAGFAPGTVGCEARDTACGPQIRTRRSDGDVAVALSNAFAFGGNNCVLAFARDAAAWQERRVA